MFNFLSGQNNVPPQLMQMLQQS
jgi:hypothetical protein